MANGAEKDVEALLLRERVFRRRPGDIPYPLNYSSDLRNYDNWDHIFFKKCFQGLTMIQFDVPPETVLDIGCGSGIWVLEAAEQWQNSTIIGMDISENQPRLETLEPYKHLASRMKWVRGNFLDGLPFSSSHFDFVRMARIGLGVPEDEWQFVLEEVLRVMKPGAVLEILEEDLIFPYCRAARRRPRPTPLDVSILPTESLSSPRSSITAFSSSPWDRSQEDLVDSFLPKKSSLSTLQESPTSTLHFSPKSTFSHRSNTSSLIPRTSHLSSTISLPQINLFDNHPQDHSHLKAAWDAMLSHRFLAPQLITVLPFYLSSCFVDVMTHPTLHIPLPQNSSSDARISRPAKASLMIDPKEQFELKRAAAVRSSDSDENVNVRATSNNPNNLSAWAPMHLARAVGTVSACKEAIWEEYAKLYHIELPPTTTQARLKEGHRAVNSARTAVRESFDCAWGHWESDMTDRIGMRDNITFELLWTEPPGERPDWRVWRNNLDDNAFEGLSGTDVCRTLRGFVAHKRNAA